MVHFQSLSFFHYFIMSKQQNLGLERETRMFTPMEATLDKSFGKNKLILQGKNMCLFFVSHHRL